MTAGFLLGVTLLASGTEVGKIGGGQIVEWGQHGPRVCWAKFSLT